MPPSTRLLPPLPAVGGVEHTTTTAYMHTGETDKHKNSVIRSKTIDWGTYLGSNQDHARIGKTRERFVLINSHIQVRAV